MVTPKVYEQKVHKENEKDIKACHFRKVNEIESLFFKMVNKLIAVQIDVSDQKEKDIKNEKHDITTEYTDHMGIL